MAFLTREQFVKKYSPFVLKITKGTGIFPQTLLSQAIIESQGKFEGKYYPGASKLAKDYNNYFGIKASSPWKGKTVNISTGEILDGKAVVIKDNFRVYNSVEDSIKDYVSFLKNNKRYTTAGVFTATNPKEQAERLLRAGYATNPSYADMIVSVGESIKKNITPGAAATGLVAVLVFVGLGIYFYKN